MPAAGANEGGDDRPDNGACGQITRQIPAALTSRQIPQRALPDESRIFSLTLAVSRGHLSAQIGSNSPSSEGFNFQFSMIYESYHGQGRKHKKERME